MLNILRYLTFPFSLLYNFITFLRNKCYDFKIFKAHTFKDLKIIAVGNLSVGGTGKTPHIEFLIKLLNTEFNGKIATLSRGYGRQTKGFRLVSSQNTSEEVGDEALQIKTKFPNTIVAVGEKRAVAIPQILAQHPDYQLVLLDDAFQHRAIRADSQILLTDYRRLFTRDFVLPMGNLRESRKGYQRADIIIVTKCPLGLKAAEKQQIIQEIRPLPQQKVFFSHLKYGSLYPLLSDFNLPKLNDNWSKSTTVLLVCGIARPQYLVDYLAEKKGVKSLEKLLFRDHHAFKLGDLDLIQQKFEAIKTDNKIIITTEKDAMRLLLHRKYLLQKALPIYCLPIQVFFEEKKRILELKKALLSFIK